MKFSIRTILIATFAIAALIALGQAWHSWRYRFQLTETTVTLVNWVPQRGYEVNGGHNGKYRLDAKSVSGDTETWIHVHTDFFNNAGQSGGYGAYGLECSYSSTSKEFGISLDHSEFEWKIDDRLPYIYTTIQKFRVSERVLQLFIVVELHAHNGEKLDSNTMTITLIDFDSGQNAG